MTTAATGASLWPEIVGTAPADGTIVLWWLYQSGFVLKTPAGTVVTIDPYLSDAVMRTYNLPRKPLAPLDAAEADVDAVLATHSHADHLDPDSILPFASHSRARFVGPPMATAKVVEAGVSPERTVPLARGDETAVGDLRIRAVFARHLFGLEPTPDAIGFVVSCGEVSLYHGGDTEYDSEIVNDTRGVTVTVISINGTTGCMNAHEAAMLAWRQQARLAIPMHYGLWHDADYGEGATLDPQLFVETYRRLSPEGRTFVLEPAKALVIDAAGGTA